MSITPRLSRKLKQVLGEEAEDLVTWMDRVDSGSAEWREAMRADFAEQRHHTEAAIAGLRQEMLVGFATLRQEMAQMEARLERRFSDLIKWSFVFWVGAVAAIAMLAGVIP
ncbi:MAG: hypothetical protein HY560_06620 [Gemmatimonadetes bacterium]|nr:hypothetical protein [Gemmatimonadota bacterium]